MTRHLLFSITVLSLGAVHAVADPVDLYGFGARGSSMAGATAALADDYEASMVNPAMLPFSKKSLGFGFTYVFDDVSIRLKPRPDGIDPEGYDKRFNVRADNNDITPNQGLVLSMNHNFRIPRFGFGFAMYFPTRALQVQTTKYNNEIEQYASNTLSFELIGERTQRQVLKAGVGYEIFDNVSVGVGGTFLTVSRTNNFVFQPDAFDSSQVFITLDNEILHTGFLEAGLGFTPGERLRLAAVWRQQYDFPINGTTSTNVNVEISPGFGVELFSRRPLNSLIKYTPQQVIVSGSYKLRDNLTLAGELTWYDWSEYRNNLRERPVPEPEDVIRPAVGIEYKLEELWVFRGGYKFTQSPLDEKQSEGRYNYVDTDMHTLTAGVAVQFEAYDNLMEFGLFAQWHHLVEQDITKNPNADIPVIDEDPDAPGLQTGNPGYPGYTADGALYVVGFTLSYWN